VAFVERLRQTLRRHEDSTIPPVRWSIGALRSVVHSGRTAKTFLFDREYRTLVLLKAFRGRELHQTTVLTWEDRYPEIFGLCQAHLKKRRDLTILSFGCSTGEEVITLREYFPSARIVGAEINPRSLAICRARTVDDRIVFLESNAQSIEREGPYDVVFCLAVLQRTPHAVKDQGVKSLAQTYPFAMFDAQVSEFDRVLKDGGLLVLHHTQYMFTDASVAAGYAALDEQPKPELEWPRFDRNSQLIEGEVATPSIYVKRVSRESE